MGGNEGAGVNTKGSKRIGTAEGLGEEMRQKRDMGFPWTLLIMAMVVFHSDMSGSSKNITSGFYLSDVLKQPSFKSVLWLYLQGEVGLYLHNFSILKFLSNYCPDWVLQEWDYFILTQHWLTTGLVILALKR